MKEPHKLKYKYCICMKCITSGISLPASCTLGTYIKDIGLHMKDNEECKQIGNICQLKLQ